MGAVSFSLDPELAGALREALGCDVFVETGTFKGDTVAAMKDTFERVISIELSQELWEESALRFEGASSVRILHGSSPQVLQNLAAELSGQKVLYWLDAHWCVATDTAGARSQCPLLDELKAIRTLDENSAVLIDDARLFLAPPPAPHEIAQWPALHQILTTLYALSARHEVMVVNDVIAFYPLHAAGAMKAYGQARGVDWLAAAQSLERGERWLDESVAKEAVIHQLKAEMVEKEAVIREQEEALLAYRKAYGALMVEGRPFGRLIVSNLVARCVRRLVEIFRPRLGNLNQYSPRPLSKLPQHVTNLGVVPKISIVTPSFRQGRFIDRTIRSVLDQAYPRLEYFVQDGGSLDETVDVLRTHERNLAGWESESDGGQSDAINRGFAKTTGEVMAWLNSDDLLLPGALWVVADYFDKHPDVDVVYADRLLIDENDSEIGRWILPGHDSRVLSWADYVPQESLFWRRRIWDKIGAKVDQSFRFAMDWDLLVRFRDANARIEHIPRFIGAFRIHDQQKTSSVINEVGHQEMDRIRARVLGRSPTRNEIRQAIIPYLVRHVAVDLKYRLKTKLWRHP